MNLNNGVINYALLVFVLVLLFFIKQFFNRFFKFNFNKKDQLSKLMASLISLAICVYGIFTVDILLNLYVQLINLNQIIVLKIVYIGLFVVIMDLCYLIIKRIIYKAMKLTGMNQFFSQSNLRNQFIALVMSMAKTTLFVVYLASVLSFLFVNLYMKGYTKGFVDTNFVRSSYNERLNDYRQIESAHKQLNSFTILFNKNELFSNLYELETMVNSLNEYEENFMDDIFIDLPKTTKEEIESLYFKKFEKDLDDQSTGLFLVLLEDDYYKDLLNPPTGFISKVPVIRDLVYKNDPHLLYYRYLENNLYLIEFINENRDYIADIDTNYQNLIVNLDDEKRLLLEVKDPQYQIGLQAIFDSIDRYFTINNWVIDVIEKEDETYFEEDITPYQIIDEMVFDFLKDGNNLDLVIKTFNNDYLNHQFDKTLFKEAFQYTNLYLEKYQKSSLEIEKEIDPNLRLAAAFFKSELNTEQYTDSGSITQIFLLYLNSNDQILTNNLADTLLYGYFYDIDTKTLDDSKLEQFLNQIQYEANEQLLFELTELNDRLLPYYITHYKEGNISYQMLKVLINHEEVTSEPFHDELKSLLK